MLDWGDLRFFLELARSGTLAATARKLKVDNTTVGRRLTSLESDLGAKLFTRTPDGLVLTTAGEAMQIASEEMETSVLRGQQQVLGADRTLAGVVRVASTEMLGEFVVLPATRAVHLAHPQIRVDVAVGTNRVDIARREADVAIRYVPPEGADLVARRVGSVAFGAYAAKSYLSSRGRPKRGEGLAGHDLVTYESGIRHWRPPEIGGESTRDAAVVVRTNSTRMMLQAVREGLGIAALPCCIAEPDPKLERVPKGAALELDAIWLVVHRDVQRTARVRVVIDAIEARLSSVASELIGT